MFRENITTIYTQRNSVTASQAFSIALLEMMDVGLKIVPCDSIPENMPMQSMALGFDTADDTKNHMDLMSIWEDYVDIRFSESKYDPSALDFYRNSFIQVIHSGSPIFSITFQAFNSKRDAYFCAVGLATDILSAVMADIRTQGRSLLDVQCATEVAKDIKCKYIIAERKAPTDNAMAWISQNSTEQLAVISMVTGGGCMIQSIEDHTPNGPVARYLFPENLRDTHDYRDTKYPDELIKYCAGSGKYAIFYSYDAAMAYAERVFK